MWLCRSAPRRLVLELASLGLVTLPLSSLSAQSTESLDNSLAPVVVTATRVAQTADATLTPVTVITHDDIVHSQALSLEDVLRGQPGLDLVNNGGLGKTTSVFLRGTNAGHVLVLIDGVKVGSATTGTTAFEDIPIALIDHIEIVRGSRSSLYGSEAIGGVIQIFTRKGAAQFSPSAAIGGGRYGTWDGVASLAGSIGSGGWYSLGLSALQTQGFNACQGSLSAGCFTVEPDQDGYRTRSGRMRAGWRFDNGTEIEVNGLRTQNHTYYDGSFTNEARTRQQVASVSLKIQPWQSWQSSLRLGQSLDRSDSFKNERYINHFDTRRDSGSWQNNIALTAQHAVVWGVDYQRDHISSLVQYRANARDNTGIFGQYLGDLGQHHTQLALRHDQNQQFGSRTTGSATWGYDINRQWRWTTAYSTGFKAPTFNELYYPYFGNPDLQPEKSYSWDIGLEGRQQVHRWGLHAYQIRIHDLIGFDARYEAMNLQSARIRGLELTGSTQWLGWQWNGNLHWLDPHNQTPSLYENQLFGRLLPRRAKYTFGLDVDRQLGAWRLGLTWRGAGKRYDDLANRVKLGGYTTMDLRGEYQIAPAWQLQARVENLFNKDYQTAYLYNQPRAGVSVTLRYQPK